MRFGYLKVFFRKQNIKSDENQRKFEYKSDKGIFLGHSLKSKEYWCQNTKTNKILDYANVRVDDFLEQYDEGSSR